MLHLHDDSDEVSIMSYEKVKVVNGDGEFDEEDEEDEDEDDEVQFVQFVRYFEWSFEVKLFAFGRLDWRFCAVFL